MLGGAHKLTQWMTAPSLEVLCDGMLSASKEKASHQKQVGICAVCAGFPTPGTVRLICSSWSHLQGFLLSTLSAWNVADVSCPHGLPSPTFDNACF